MNLDLQKSKQLTHLTYAGEFFLSVYVFEDNRHFTTNDSQLPLREKNTEMLKNEKMEMTWTLLQISSTVPAKHFVFFYCCHSMVSFVHLENTFYTGDWVSLAIFILAPVKGFRSEVHIQDHEFKSLEKMSFQNSGGRRVEPELPGFD